MADYPNHLARVEILHDYQRVPIYRTRYEPAWRPIPNLAIDLVMAGLLQVAPIETAGKIFLSLIVVLFAAGCHFLGVAVHGRPSWIALVATFFTYNFCMSSGFVNYMFGLGVFFIALAVWLRSRETWTPMRWGGVAVLAVAAYLSHLSSYIFLLVAGVVLTVVDVIRRRDVSRSHLWGLACLTPPLIMLIVSLATSEKVPLEWWHPIVVKKLIGLAYPFVSYHVRLDVLLGALFVILVLAAAWPANCLHVRPEIMVVAAVFLLLYLVAPMQGGVESNYLDRRFIVPVFVLALIAMRIDLTKTAGRVILAALFMLWTIRMAEVAWTWRQVDREIRAQVALTEKIPVGATMFPVFLGDLSIDMWPHDMQFSQSFHYATVTRHVFVPSLFAKSSAFPLQFMVQNDGPTEIRRSTASESVAWDSVFARFDYVWTYKLTGEYRRAVESRGTLLAESGDTRVYKTAR